jgi:hypothetical protein
MMAARRKKPVAPAAVDARALAVVVETLRGDFRVFGEALSGLSGQMSSLRTEVHGEISRLRTEVHDEISSLRTEVHDEISSLRTEVHGGFDRVDRELAGVKDELGLVKSAVLEHGRELREIRDRKVDRDEVEGIVQGVLARAR